MSKDTWFWSIFSAALIVIFLVASIWLIFIAAESFTKIAVAIIGAAAVVLGAVVKHSLELERERIHREGLAKQERDHREWLAKQENYKELLGRIGNFARKNPSEKDARDSLTSSHLGSWAFGDLTVMKSTNAFIKNRKRNDLVALLEDIRKSLQQSELPKDFFKDYDANVLFPTEVKIVDGLEGNGDMEKENDKEKEDP